MIDQKKYKRSEDCIPVKGYLRSLVMDLIRKSYNFIPADLYEILNPKDRLIWNKKNAPISQEYIEFLLENEYIFECKKNELKFFPKLDTVWDYPAYITNAVIEIDGQQMINADVVRQIISLGCNHFVFVCVDLIEPDYLSKLSDLFESTSVMTLEIIAKYIPDIKENDFYSIMKKNPRISYILFHSSPDENIISLQDVRGNLAFTNIGIDYEKCNVSEKYFNANMILYTEALKYNTFFHRKLCIDKEYNIKNYFTQEKNFGNAKNDKIEIIINNDDFKKVWYVCKEMIDICQVCEFRYMCIDSRFPIERKDGSYYFQQECNYNPFICKWKGEDSYMSLQECGIIVNAAETIINHEQIMEINKKIWGEDIF